MREKEKIELSRPQMEIMKSIQQINLFMAGVGSGKSFIGGVMSAMLVLNFPGVDGFIAANTHEQLNTSTFKAIRTAWDMLDFKEYNPDTGEGCYYIGKQPPAHFNTENHNFISYDKIVSIDNGSVIYLGSLENAKAHEGKQFGWAILDETKDSREEDVKEIILSRLRQRGIFIKDGKKTTDETGEAFNPLYILTSPAKTDWINNWFQLETWIEEIKERIYQDGNYFKKEFENKCVVISSTHHNLVNLPANYIDNKRFDLSENQLASRIYGDPFQKTGGEFWHSFVRTEHVGKTEYANRPLHISFDYNVVPYITATIWEIETQGETYMAKCIDEICLENPKNNTEALCNEIIRRHDSKMEKGLFYYGDASGKSRDTRSRKNDYEIIEDVLAGFINQSSDRTERKNPSVIKSRDFVNKIFENKLPVRVMINESCKNLIADLMYLKEDIDGTAKKERAKNPDTGASYEKYGHTSDSMRYFLCSAFKGYFK